MAKIFRNPEVMWREETELKEKAYKDLEEGSNVEEVGTSILFANGMMLSLNILGTEIWKRCDGKTLDEIVSELLQVFDVDSEVLRKDVSGFMDELREKGYLYDEE